MTPSAQRAAAVAAKAKSLLNKTEENKRAYQRRKERERLMELHRLSGVESYLTRTADATKTHPALKWMNLKPKKERHESVKQNLPDHEIKSLRREWIDTPEDRAEVRRILARK